MRHMRARRALAGGALLVFALGGCTADPAVDGDADAEPTAGVDFDATEAAELRLLLEQQFGMFTTATIAVVREPDASADAAAVSFNRTVADLTATVAEAYDRQTAQEVASVLERYPATLADHAEALREDRRPAATRETVLGLPTLLAAQMAAATEDGMEEEGTAALVRAPTVALLQVVAAEVERDYETAYARQREAYSAMLSVGRAFAAGISEQQPDTYPGLRNSGAIELRSALQQLFGEHAVLAADVLRRGVRGARDFDAAAAALNGNTEDLTAALESIYSDEASQFGVLWRERISALADSAVAVAEQRTKRLAEVRTALARTDADIAAELQTMSEGAVSSDDASRALRSLTGAFLQHAAAAAAKDFDRAGPLVRSAHGEATVLGDIVATGIAEHRPTEFPTR